MSHYKEIMKTLYRVQCEYCKGVGEKQHTLGFTRIYLCPACHGNGINVHSDYMIRLIKSLGYISE